MNFDVTFCKAWIRCKKGDHCHLALTENVKEIARQTGNHIWSIEQRECFEPKSLNSKENIGGFILAETD